jgi:hypothetical protein
MLEAEQCAVAQNFEISESRVSEKRVQPLRLVSSLRVPSNDDIDEDAKRRLEMLAESQGMTQLSVVSAMVQWFVSLSLEEQRLVLTKGKRGLATRTRVQRLASRKASE